MSDYILDITTHFLYDFHILRSLLTEDGHSIYVDYNVNIISMATYGVYMFLDIYTHYRSKIDEK